MSQSQDEMTDIADLPREDGEPGTSTMTGMMGNEPPLKWESKVVAAFGDTEDKGGTEDTTEPADS